VHLRIPEKPARRVFDWLRGSPTGLVVSALAVGLGAGLGAVAFRYLILWFTIFFTGHQDYSGADHAPYTYLPQLGMWFVALVPVVGGLLYGPLTERFAREARGHGVPEVMLAVAEQGGRIRPRVAVIKALASAICIGAGGSVGREGPIVQIGSALGSSVGQALRMPESRLRLLVACGAAGWISATFNTPIAGVLFGLELILRDFEAASFGVVVLSSVTANVVGRAAFGPRPFLTLPPFELGSLWELFLYAVLGLLAAIVGVAFIRALYGLEDAVDRVWHGPEWLRPAAGGVVLGLLLLALPEMYGVGYPVLEQAIGGSYGASMLLVLLGGKILATSLTIAIGGSGGVFAPSLFMGAMLGTVFGQGLHHLLPTTVAHPGAFGLVGMGAVFAPAARAPLTSAIIIFELTDEYRTILPLLFSIAVATGLSNLLTRDTIYTLKLRRRGIDILRGRPASLMEIITVGEAMGRTPDPVLQDQALGAVLDRFTHERREELPVVNGDGTYKGTGTVTAHQVEEAIRDNVLDATVGSLAQATPTVTAGQSLAWALRTFVRHELPAVPVLAEDGRSIVGWLTHRDARPGAQGLGARVRCRDRGVADRAQYGRSGREVITYCPPGGAPVPLASSP
jgi:CIC family chloride channel protein